MRIPEKIETKRLVLRKLNHVDAPAIYEGIKLKDVSRWLTAVPYPYPKDLALKFVLESILEFENAKGFSFGIVIKGKTKEPAGLVTLDRLDYGNKSAALGYWLGKKHWGQGYMSEAVKEVLSFGFHTLKLHRIWSNVYPENPASERILLKSGFILEGREREKYFKEGAWRDYLYYGLLEEEYK